MNTHWYNAMPKLLKTCMTALLTVVIGMPVAQAGADQDRTAQLASETLHDIAEIPEEGIPPALLTNAYAVAVIPRVIKAGLLFGGRYGTGLLTVRTANNEWSNPAFVELYGGSFGLQVGVQSTDVVLVFKHRKSIDDIVNGKVTLGADASVAAGPVGRRAEASTDAELQAEVYSYSRSRGLFAGVSLEGAIIQIDYPANDSFYGQAYSASEILSDQPIQRPVEASRFLDVLNRYTPKPSPL